VSGPDERARREIDDEIHAHLDARTAQLIAHGLAPDVAQAEARRRFGNLEVGRAALYAQATRVERRRQFVHRVESVLQDLRYAGKGLRRQPGLVVGIVSTLAIGIGVNSAVFRIADRVLVQAPVGVRAPAEIRRVETVSSTGAEATRAAVFSYPEARILIDARAFEPAAIDTPPRLVTADNGRQVAVAYVDATFFRLLGVEAAVGRLFDPTEATVGANVPVAVVSARYWQHDLAGAPITDRLTLTLDHQTYRVVGVAAGGFSGVDIDPTEVWLPLGVAVLGRITVNGVVTPWYRTDMTRALRIVGRLPATQVTDAAAARLTGVLSALDRAHGRDLRRVELSPIVPVGGASVNQAARRLLSRLSGVAILVLIIACANATHLLLARGLRRQREIATRLALGASRARIWRLLLIESSLVALIASLAAMLGGGWAAAALRRLILPDARWTTALVDGRTLAFTCVLAVGAGLVAGVAPAAQATSSNLLQAMKTGLGGPLKRARTTRGALLVIQAALSIVLIVGSGLLVESLVRLNAVSLGFDPRGLVTVSLLSAEISGGSSSAVAADTLAGRLVGTPRPPEVALASVAPFGASKVVDVIVPGSTFTPPSDRDTPRVSDVSPNFLKVMRMGLISGRTFTEDDVTGEPVAIVSVSMARNYWGAIVPAGACVLPVGSPCARVVGVVDDIREAPGVETPMRYYLPLDAAHAAAPGQPTTLVVRVASGDGPGLAARVRAMLPPTQRASIEVTADRLDHALRPWRTATWLFVGLGLTALVLACLGVYSIIGYGALERRRELGIRAALGATRRDLAGLVLGGGLRLALVGGLLGLVLSAAAGRLIASLLFDVSPFDGRVYFAALVAVLVAATGAMWPAVRRASRVDPVIALREEG
jgi:putative ABC transport system permease protein